MNSFLSPRRFALAEPEPEPSRVQQLFDALTDKPEQLDISHYRGATVIRWLPLPDPCAFAIIWARGNVTFHESLFACQVEIRARARNKVENNPCAVNVNPLLCG